MLPFAGKKKEKKKDFDIKDFVNLGIVKNTKT